MNIIVWPGAIQLMQMQEDIKRQLQSGQIGEANVGNFLESKQQMMLDSLWKLNVADIELTISHVCQAVLHDPNVSKGDLRLRAKALKKLGSIFQEPFAPKNIAAQTTGNNHGVNTSSTSNPKSPKFSPTFHTETSSPHQGGGPVPTPPQGASSRYHHSTGPSSGGFGTQP
jgi:hypothetical protein